MLPVNNQLTMSSREIAELTEKEHKTVMRDIRVMLKDLGHGTDLYLGKYTANNRQYDEYNLPKRETLLLVSGYMLHVRVKIVDRLEYLESKANQPQIPTNFAEALQLAADQAKQLELQAPKVAFVDNLVDRTGLMNATQVGQPHGLSAVKLNKMLDEFNVYNKAVKRGRAFQQWFIDKGYGEMKQTDAGFPQALFTNAGAVWINGKLISEGVV